MIPPRRSHWEITESDVAATVAAGIHARSALRGIDALSFGDSVRCGIQIGRASCRERVYVLV